MGGVCCCWKAPKPDWATLPPLLRLKLPLAENAAEVAVQPPKAEAPKLEAPRLPKRPEACPEAPKELEPPNTFLPEVSEAGLLPKPLRNPELLVANKPGPDPAAC